MKKAILKEKGGGFAMKAIDRQSKLAAEQETKPILFERSWAVADERPIDLTKLRPYVRSPRDPSSELVREMASEVGFFARKKEIRALSAAPLVFACVVSCDDRILTPGQSRFTNAVICYAADDGHRLNIDWLSRTCESLNRMPSSGGTKNEKKIARLMGDMATHYIAPLPLELSSDSADAWLATIRLEDQALLPHGCLPAQRILPFLVAQSGKSHPLRRFRLIPRRFYEAKPENGL
ncbi:MAG: hypothetical protein LBC69_02145 [Eubacteriaceae bacterium]|jgi:hypothetical protein|nr:hypothetical protein [Eubacteriaceae bacterium]